MCTSVKGNLGDKFSGYAAGGSPQPNTILSPKSDRSSTEVIRKGNYLAFVVSYQKTICQNTWNCRFLGNSCSYNF